MRLIDADAFKEKVLSGLYIYLQENKEDIARAIDDEPTVETSIEHFVDLKTFKHVDCEYLTPCGLCKFKSSYKELKFCNKFQPT